VLSIFQNKLILLSNAVTQIWNVHFEFLWHGINGGLCRSLGVLSKLIILACDVRWSLSYGHIHCAVFPPPFVCVCASSLWTHVTHTAHSHIWKDDSFCLFQIMYTN
jgi:hypothetical protein